MGAIVVVDTSVLLNILDVPGCDQDKDKVLAELATSIEEGDHLFIPMTAIVEVGNHIAHVPDGDLRRKAAIRFANEVRKALRNEAPWKPINLPTNEEVLSWIDSFPEYATRGIGMGDLAIKEEWEDLCNKNRMSRVRVWSLDVHLAGLDRAASS